VKANRLIEVVETLVKLADKEIYYKRNDLFLSFSTEDSTYVVEARNDGLVCLSVYFGFEMDFKFYLDKSGNILVDKGTTPDIVQNYGLDQAVDLINNCGDSLLIFGNEAIESGNYDFKTFGQLKREIDSIKNIDSSIQDPDTEETIKKH